MSNPDRLENDPNSPPIDLKDIILRLTHSDEVMVPDTVRSIALGTFGDQARGLHQRTQQDPEKIEHGRPVFVTHDGKVLIRTSDIVGRKTARGQEIEIGWKYIINPNGQGRRSAVDRYLAGVIHAHPSPYPPSMMDLQGLLLTPSDPNSETFVYVSNSHGHILVFRGPTTPRLTSKKAKSFIEKATLFTLAAVTKLSESGFEGDSDERMQIVIFS